MIHDDFGVIGWQKSSFVDFPGTVSTVLFFRGCNLRCPYCHNPAIVLNSLPAIAISDVVNFLKKRSGIIDGVVLSGGEPTLHNNLPQVIDTLRMLNLSIKLDTNGLRPEMIALCKPDYLAMDIKADPLEYGNVGYDGQDAVEKLRQSIAIVKSMANKAEIRITVAPHLIHEKSINRIADLIEDVECVYLQQVVTDGQILNDFITENKTINHNEQKPYPIETLEAFRTILSERVKCCKIRGTE